VGAWSGGLRRRPPQTNGVLYSLFFTEGERRGGGEEERRGGGEGRRGDKGFSAEGDKGRVLSSLVVGCLVGRVSSVSASWVADRRFLVVAVISRVGADRWWVV